MKRDLGAQHVPAQLPDAATGVRERCVALAHGLYLAILALYVEVELAVTRRLPQIDSGSFECHP